MGPALISLEENSVWGFVVADIMSAENAGEWLTVRMSAVMRTIQNTTVPK